MTRNQMIALGCGGAGCLGLIIVAVAGVLLFFFSSRSPSYSTNRRANSNVTIIRNSNSNDNADANGNENSSSTTTSTAASMSDDDKHKLYQAAAMTGDAELLRRVSVKIGLMDEDYTPSEDYQRFLTDHVAWVMRNTDFIRSINTSEKARAYVDLNFRD